MATASGWPTRRTCPGCRPPRPSAGSGTGWAEDGGSRRSARQASAVCATRRSRTMGGTPGAAGSGPCWEPSGGKLGGARDLRGRSFGPATAKYRELGTLANLLAFNAISTLPSRNFQTATFEGAPQLAAEELAQLRTVTRNSCASCTIGCEHIYRAKGGKQARVEYENVFALGPMCGVSDPDAVLAASGRCYELGLDTT